MKNTNKILQQIAIDTAKIVLRESIGKPMDSVLKNMIIKTPNGSVPMMLIYDMLVAASTRVNLREGLELDYCYTIHRSSLEPDHVLDWVLDIIGYPKDPLGDSHPKPRDHPVYMFIIMCVDNQDYAGYIKSLIHWREFPPMVDWLRAGTGAEVAEIIYGPTAKVNKVLPLLERI